MKKLLLFAALLFMVLPLLAQVSDPTPTPVAVPAMSTAIAVSPGQAALIWLILKYGLLLCACIEGLKATAKDWFEAHPNAAKVINAVISFIVGIALCFFMDKSSFDIVCVVKSVGIFLTAAGIYHAAVSPLKKMVELREIDVVNRSTEAYARPIPPPNKKG